ncbi:MAG TPA: PQQ-binding-like beta-propeller repeat protein, partial [Thermoplasmata archaeon]|nr:PQQ-binding-like beta-propeller repeat protein [Thermoplasmata archaeon]
MASGFVYAGSWNGHLYEFNATSGQEVWNLTLTTPHVAGYGSTYGACWREGGIPSTPTVTVSRAGGVSYNTVFVTAGTGLYSINATRAAYQPGQAINWFTNLTNYSDVPNAGRDWGYHYLWSSPLIYNGSAYAGVAETCDARSVQAQLFQIPLAGSGPYHAPAHIFDVTGASGTAPDVAGGIWSTPSVDPVTNLLWVSTGNENSTWSGSWSQYYTRSILALNASNVSELVGSAQVGSSGTDEDFGAGPTLFHDAAGRSLVGAINKDGIFYAYDASHFGSGTCFPGLPSPCLLPAWTQSTGSYGVSLISIAPSAFGGGKLFVPSGPSGNGSWDGVVSALLPSNGTIEWQQPIGGPSGGYVPLAGLTYANGLLIDAANGFDQGRADGNGIVEIRNASDGAVVWQRLLNQSIDGEVVASGDLVLFGTGSGSNTTGFVTAYRITPPTPPPPKLLLASQPSVDLGQSVNFTANVSSAFGPGAFRWNASSGLGCLSSSNRLLSCHPSATGATYSVSFVATGANITSAQAALTNFVVHRLPRVFAPSPSATSVDVNQTILFRATTFGGSGGGTFLWTNLSTALGCTPSSNSTLRCSPNSVGTGFGVSVSWTDSNGIASPSVPSAAVSVFASPSVFPPAPSSPLADLGQSVVFTASTTGGTGGAVFNWSATSPALRCAPSAGPRLACVANASASGVTVAVRWTDAAGQSSAWVASQPLEVDEDPVSGPPIASVPRADVGEWIVFQANVSGGSGGGRYDWSGFGPSLGCLNSTSALLDCRPTLPGSYLVSLNWTDSAGESSGVGSATTVSVSGDPFIAPLSASRTSADLGQSIVLSTEVSGGAGGYRYHWSVPDGLGCPLVDAPSIVCWPTASGSSYVAWVTVSDANGISTDVVTSAQLSVFDPPSVTTPTATRPSADAGQTVRFATKVGGGAGGLDYTWTGLPGSCSG